MVDERPNLADVNADGLQDTGAPTPEYLARRALDRARAEDRHVTLADLQRVLDHLRRVREREL
jgi:hypothetical protein